MVYLKFLQRSSPQIIFIPILGLLIANFPLRAEDEPLSSQIGFYAKRSYFEIRGGRDLQLGGSSQSDLNIIAAPENFGEDPFDSALTDTVGPYTLSNGSAADKLESYFIFENTPESKMSSKLIEFLYEYSFSDKIGVGFTYHHEEYDVENISLNKSYLLFVETFSTLNGSSGNLSTQEKINLEKYSPLINIKIPQVLRINTIEFNIAYHFLVKAGVNQHLRYFMTSNNFDPYIRLHVGFGKEDHYQGVNIMRYGISGGTRYFFNNNLYSVAELNYSQFESADSENFWKFYELSISLGAGYAL